MVVRGNPRFRRLLESEIRAFEVERLPECAGSLAESTVDQGLKGRASLARCRNTSDWFYTSVNGRSVWVIIAIHNGREYLITEADGYEPNNLLSLPECP